MLGKKIKRLREEKEISQKELGKELGVSASTIGMWEQDRRSPDNEALKSISDYFNVSVDYLLGINTSEKRKQESLGDMIDKLLKEHNIWQDIKEEDYPEYAENFIKILEIMKKK